MHQTQALTFDGEVHGLADISSHVVADLTQVEATVVLQHMFDQQRTIAQQLDTRAAVQWDGLKLGDAGAWYKGKRKRHRVETVNDKKINIYI